METFSALLAICAGNSPVPGEFPTQRPVTRSFDVYFDLRPNKRLSKQSWGWWFETLSCPLWRHRNVIKGALVLKSVYIYATFSVWFSVMVYSVISFQSIKQNQIILLANISCLQCFIILNKSCNLFFVETGIFITIWFLFIIGCFPHKTSFEYSKCHVWP